MMYLYQMNCLGQNTVPFFQKQPLNWDFLFLYMIITLIIIELLLTYYNKVSNTTNSISSQIDTPLYASKDLFSQDTLGESNFLIADKEVSISTKIVIFVLVALIITTSMMTLLTNGVIEYLD